MPRPLFSLLLVATLVSAAAADENWPQWRGPRGNSTSDARDLPIAWEPTSGIAWQTPLPGWGNSTPAIWGDAIFVTLQQNEELLLLRIARSDGKLVWTQKVGRGEVPRKEERGRQKFHRLHNLASPSPVTDGRAVVAHFGNGDLAAYDFDGRQLWHHNLAEAFGPYTVWWGHANSPVIHGDLVISVCMQDRLTDLDQPPGARSYLVAHDLLTGEQRWTTSRQTEATAEECDAYTTPILRTHEGQAELLVMGGNQLDAYDPATGRQIWFLPGLIGGRTVTGPTLGDGLVYVTRGMRGPLLAVRAGGEGRRDRKSIVWQDSQGTPDSCCPVVWSDLLFTVSDDGIARCFDALRGKLHWKKRLPGKYKASPLAADGRIYFLNTDGLTSVVSASSRFDKLTENRLDDETLASPAVAAGRLFIRGRESLYAIGR